MNPTGQPYGMPPGSPPPVSFDARAAVSVPALLLAIAGGMAVVWAVVNLLSAAMTSGSPDWLLNMVKDPAMRQQMQEMLKQSESNKLLNYGWPVVMMLANAGVVVGALMMRSLKMYPVAMMAAIVSVIPCLFTSCCCVTSMPAAIWALIVLMKPEVRSQFT
ncbi:MAG: hypothetical protein AB1938_27745 [Myxococcota bacterium]